ncbi:MAG: trehalose-phosphatase [Kouleothrix sp.]|nr:trehalose-phosphatase [Kouleothrix sp.]
MSYVPISFSAWEERAAFFQQVARARRRLLMLDYDGTLASFTKDRDQAYPYEGVRERLQRLVRSTTTRIVVVSGRAIANLRPLLGVEPLPELWGTHGWERLSSNGIYQLPSLPAQTQQVLNAEVAALRAAGLAEHHEEKPAGVAVHWRDLPPAVMDRIQAFVGPRWAHIHPSAGLEVHAFDGGLELQAVGRTKGWAVRQLLDEETPEAAAFLGDDYTDERAFDALAGHGLCVQVRTELRQPTGATLWLRPPEELLAFLDDWIGASGSGYAS